MEKPHLNLLKIEVAKLKMLPETTWRSHLAVMRKRNFESEQKQVANIKSKVEKKWRSDD